MMRVGRPERERRGSERKKRRNERWRIVHYDAAQPLLACTIISMTAGHFSFQHKVNKAFHISLLLLQNRVFTTAVSGTMLTDSAT